MKLLQKYYYQLRSSGEQERLQRNRRFLQEEITTKIQGETNWEERCRLAKTLRLKALNNMDVLLTVFEKKSISNKNVLYWAKDGKEALERVLMLVNRAQAKSIHFDYHPTLTEIGLEQSLLKAPFHVQPSTLSHLILQKANEPATHPQHLLLDKSQKGILDFLNKKFETDIDVQAEEAKQIALKEMRHKANKYPVFPSVSIFSPNFIIADSGSMLHYDNEGSSAWNLGSTSINIAIVGIDRIMSTFDDRLLESLPVFNLFRYGDFQPNFMSLVNGPAHKDEKDGPGQSYIILLDNGRSDLLANPILKDALIDIDGWAQWFGRTWAAKIKKSDFPQEQSNHLKRLHGGHLFLQTATETDHFNPYNLDFHACLMEMRHLFVEQHGGKNEKELMAQWEKIMFNRLVVTKIRGGMKKMLFRRKLKQTFAEADSIPNVASETFSEWWATRNKKK